MKEATAEEEAGMLRGPAVGADVPQGRGKRKSGILVARFWDEGREGVKLGQQTAER